MLELDGAVISSKNQPPIYASKAARLVISSAKDTKNYITDDRNKIGSSNIDSAVYSVADITFNGEGTINVEGNYRDAIKSDGTIKIMSGEVDVIADDDGISGQLTVMKGGKASLTTGGDAIRANADNNSGILIADGAEVVVNSEGDAIYSTGDIYIKDITCNIRTGTNASKSEMLSMKGIKADKELYINNGNIVIDSEDDAIHTGGKITIEHGTIELASGDDAIHSDDELTINGGIFTITDCYEGIEGKKLIINGGDLNITAEDDGINVSGTTSVGMPPPMPGENTDPGNGMPPEMPVAEIDEETVEMDFIVNGGKIRIYSTGDGIDINGSCEINAGDIMAFALQDGPENAFDFDGICKFNGGNFFGTGNPNMAVSPSDSSECNSFIVYPPKSYQKGSTVRIVDDEGTELVNETINGSFGWIGLYGEKVIKGKTYTVIVNDEPITDILIEKTVTSITCESADGQGLPGMQTPPGMTGGGMGGNPPPEMTGGGMGGNPPPKPGEWMGGDPPPGESENSTGSENVQITDNTAEILITACCGGALILIFLFAFKCIKRKF